MEEERGQRRRQREAAATAKSDFLICFFPSPQQLLYTLPCKTSRNSKNNKAFLLQSKNSKKVSISQEEGEQRQKKGDTKKAVVKKKLF